MRGDNHCIIRSTIDVSVPFFFSYSVKPIAKLLPSVEMVQMLEKKAGTKMTVRSCLSNYLSAAVCTSEQHLCMFGVAYCLQQYST